MGDPISMETQETESGTSYPFDGVSDTRRADLTRLRRLEREANPYFSMWEEAAEHFLPGSFRRNPNERVKPPVPNADIINTAGMKARRVMESGIAASLTNPSRIWAALGTPDTDIMKYPKFKAWYFQLSEWLFNVYARSNFYQVMPRIYGSVGTHGTTCAVVEPDKRDLVRLYPYSMGSFFLANGPRLNVDTVFRRMQITVENAVRAFSLGRVSERVRKLYERKEYDQWVNILRIIEPNRNQVPGRLDYSGMAYNSRWLEVDGDARSEGPYLRVAGDHVSPILGVRWDTEDTDVYGRLSPGLMSLTDSRVLQTYGIREGQMYDYLTQPPIEGPSAIEDSYPLPGEVIPSPFGGGESTVHSVLEVKPNSAQIIDAKIRRLEGGIDEWWYVHLWMSILNDERNQRASAREIAEGHEEKLVQLGPTLVRFFDELLDPVIEYTVQLGVRESMPEWLAGRPGLFPAPPPELMGQPMKVEYISPLALALRMVGITNIERALSFVGGIYATYPAIVNKINWDRAVEIYSDRLSLDPDIVRPQDEVDQERAQQAQQQQQQQAAAQAPDLAKAGKVLSDTDVNGDSALNRLLQARGLSPTFGNGQ